MANDKITLLIVEDDEVDVELVTRGLRKRQMDFHVLTATDGDKALSILREDLPSEKKDRLVVLLDLNMPRMNGHEFLAELRQDNTLKQTIVFVLTTSSLETDRARAYQQNVAGYFVKSNLDPVLDLLGEYSRAVEFPGLSIVG